MTRLSTYQPLRTRFVEIIIFQCVSVFLMKFRNTAWFDCPTFNCPMFSWHPLGTLLKHQYCLYWQFCRCNFARMRKHNRLLSWHYLPALCLHILPRLRSNHSSRKLKQNFSAIVIINTFERKCVFVPVKFQLSCIAVVHMSHMPGQPSLSLCYCTANSACEDLGASLCCYSAWISSTSHKLLVVAVIGCPGGDKGNARIANTTCCNVGLDGPASCPATLLLLLSSTHLTMTNKSTTTRCIVVRCVVLKNWSLSFFRRDRNLVVGQKFHSILVT